ncbi:ABC transporter G family member 42 [Corchorus olitorius]|uniref:ABC transporter G family member 42 n=1 Tax=Corchorus olitorius TaxID=93759 RepID=A0A1R3KSS0_9ROSI|nr:ABC transporter G family member 42 [Corchorus olitorius]
MGGNALRDPLIPDLATVLQDFASISLDLTLTEPNFHLPISEFNRPIGLVFGYVLPEPVLFTPFVYEDLGMCLCVEFMRGSRVVCELEREILREGGSSLYLFQVSGEEMCMVPVVNSVEIRSRRRNHVHVWEGG